LTNGFLLTECNRDVTPKDFAPVCAFVELNRGPRQKMVNSPQTMKRIPSLDALRAISVSLVLIGHLARAGYTPDVLKVYAGSGVRMFFVISGYLITTILLNEHARTSSINLRQFYIRRAYRILPAAGVFMLFATVAYGHELRWIDIGAMFLYFINYDGGRPWMIGHLWSLGVEEQFYFIWPSALKMFYRQKVAILWGAVALGPIFSSICYHFKIPGGGYTYFPATAGNLAVGCLLAIYGSRIPKISPLGGAVDAVASNSYSLLPS
jgi:peptidoglycan/LPS O-acetylase OafA/YrhL